MKINENTLLRCSTDPLLHLVPYESVHVPKYNQWMQNQFLQDVTGSEPLSLEEEYKMQQNWATDEDKCTFIIIYQDDPSHNLKDCLVTNMVGDVNLFLTEEDETSKNAAELDVMIAEESFRGKGIGRKSVLMMMWYGLNVLHLQSFIAKIKMDNNASISLFKSLGFEEVSRSEAFKEITYGIKYHGAIQSVNSLGNVHVEIL